MLPQTQKDFRTVHLGFITTLHDFYIKMPIECLNEMQYALNHLMKDYVRTAGQEDHLAIVKATGHLRRAHLDYLKICLQDVYNRLASQKHSKLSTFVKKMLHARLRELQSIGEMQEESIAAYKSLLHEFCEMSGLRFSRPGNFTANHIMEEVPPHQILAADNSIDIPKNPVLQEKRKISGEDVFSYQEWAALELLLTSLRNSRHYEIILAMVESYYNQTLSAKLPYLKATLKILIIRELHKKSPADYDAVMKQPEIFAAWETCTDAATVFAESKSSNCQAMDRMIVGVDKPFTAVAAHLGIDALLHSFALSA